MLTLNFVPDLAARIILSTRAAAIWFFTGPSFPVFDMLEVRISSRTPQELEGNLQELVLYKKCLDSHIHVPNLGQRTNVNEMICLPNQLYICHPLLTRISIQQVSLYKRSECYVPSKRHGSSR